MIPETSAEAAAIPPAAAHPAPQWVLAPARDALIEGNHFRATSAEPWLRLEHSGVLMPGSIVRIRYSSNFFDDPVRPILRFWQGEDECRDHIMPAPYEGTGVWAGRIPANRHSARVAA